MKVNKPLGIAYRFYLYLREKFNPKPQITEEEKYAVRITKKIIETPDTFLYYTPISNKILIKNDSKEIYVLIQSRNVTIINHAYSYSIFIENDELYGSIMSLLNDTLEKEREGLEKEIKKKIQHSLMTISERLDD